MKTNTESIMRTLVGFFVVILGYRITVEVIHGYLEKKFKKVGKLDLIDWFLHPLYCLKLKKRYDEYEA